MILVHAKLARVVVLLKYIARVVPLISQSKILIWNKMVLLALNSMAVLELSDNELEKTFLEDI